MRAWNSVRVMAAGGMAASVILAGCVSRQPPHWLTLFFDGVPGPGTPAPALKTATSVQPTNQIAKAGTSAAPAKPLTTYVVHKPYGSDNCLACHESMFSPGMRGSMKQVCFDCHKKFQAKAQSVHDPFGNGECMDCHVPHYGTNKFLLTKSASLLCADCHDPFVSHPKSTHQPYDNGECLDCHDPHMSQNKKLVLKTGAKLCFDCHDDFLATAKFKHDPAGNGECDDCHNPHESVEVSLLTKDSRKLCFDCHDEKDVAAAKGHVNLGKATCIDCHDPHSGSDEYFLRGPGKMAAKGTSH